MKPAPRRCREITLTDERRRSNNAGMAVIPHIDGLQRRSPLLRFALGAVLMVCLSVLCPGTELCSAGDDMVLLGFAVGSAEEGSALPHGWEHLEYLGKARNRVFTERDGAKGVVRMESLGSVSSLITFPDVPLQDYPCLVWRWKVNRAVGMAMEDRKDRNDAAARVRIIFGGKGEVSAAGRDGVVKLLETMGVQIPPMEPPGFKVDYIWGNRAQAGDFLAYPGSSYHKVFVLRSGNRQAGCWRWEKRDIVEDFRRSFGTEPPGITAVLILSDTDHTNEGVTAWFGSIVLMSEQSRGGGEKQ